MATFKNGKAFDPRFGVVRTRKANDGTDDVWVNLGVEGKNHMSTDQFHRYFSDGRIHKDHANPTLLTLEEAVEKGYEIPVLPLEGRWRGELALVQHKGKDVLAFIPEAAIGESHIGTAGMIEFEGDS